MKLIVVSKETGVRHAIKPPRRFSRKSFTYCGRQIFINVAEFSYDGSFPEVDCEYCSRQIRLHSADKLG